MNTPQSPFAPLQELQEERNEGWMEETPFEGSTDYDLAEKDAKIAEQAAQIVALQTIAAYNKSSEIKGDEEYLFDPVYGYDWCIEIARAAFARAVREAVEKERADSQASNNEGPKIQTAFHGVITPPKTVSWEAYEEALKVQAERWRKRQADRDANQAEEIARLTAELASLQKAYEGERNCSGERMQQILNLQRELAKANAELERLREALRSAAAVIGQKIEGKLIHAYLEQQFPATKGHAPLKKYYQSLGCELVNIAAVLPPPAPTAQQEMEAAYQASLKDTWMDAKQWNSKEAFAKGWQARDSKEKP